MKELLQIQEKLNVPKNLYNAFGKYKYRSAESILEVVKPLLKETKTILLLSDEIIREENRYYIKATARLINEEGKEVVVTGFAREEETKKGMDGSQITGASSSYARKYALNGLFAIDDGKDSDATNTHGIDDGKKAQDSKKNDLPWYNDFEKHQELIIEKIKNGKTADEIIKDLTKQYKVNTKIRQSIKDLESDYR